MKRSTSPKRSLRKAGTAGFIAASLALGTSMPLVASVPLAVAATDTGNVTITATSGNEGVTYKALRIFTADIDGTNTVKNIAWSTTSVHNAVIKAITAFDSTYTDPENANESAQKAAEFIQAHISDATGTAPSQDSTLILDSGTFGMQLADAIDGFKAGTTITPGEKTELETGYYLFVATPSTLGEGTSGTSPIFAVVGGADLSITEKTSVPVVSKTAIDEQGKTALAIDSFIGKKVTYQLTGTLPANLASFKTFSYTFTDTLSAGLTANLDSVKVTVGGVDVTARFTKTLENNVLTVGMDNLLDVEGVKASDAVVVTYTATLNSAATTGATGNDNQVSITYSNNPNATTTSTSKKQATRTYTYKLSLHKQDKNAASRSLEGAKFQIKVASHEDSSLEGLYVQADGSLAKTAYSFTTNSDGDFSVSGLDQGMYLITEVEAPATDNGSYETIDPVTLTIDSNVEDLSSTAVANQKLALSATVTGDADAVVAASVDASATAEGSGVNASTGEVSLVVRDTKRTTMPVTGDTGIALPCLVAIGAAGVSLFALRSRTHARARSGAPTKMH